MKQNIKKLYFILTLATFFGCRNLHKEELYWNVKGKIVSMGNDNTLTQDKFKNPVLCANVLIQAEFDTTMFMELSTCNHDDRNMINKAWYYNHRIGDKIRFDYIRKDRWFKINR